MAKKTQAVFTQEQEAAPIQDPLVNGDTLGAHNILRLRDGQSWDISLKSYSALADISPHPSPAEWAMLGLLPARPGPGSIAAVPGLLRTKCPPWCRQPTICIQMRGESWRALASRGMEAMAWAKRRGWPACSPQNLQAWGGPGGQAKAISQAVPTGPAVGCGMFPALQHHPAPSVCLFSLS